MQNVGNTTRTFGQYLGEMARAFLRTLGEFAERVDALPLEDKQPLKEMLATVSPHAAKQLRKDDDELGRILSEQGWWVLQKDINGPVKRELLRLGRGVESCEIDNYLCSLFKEASEAKLQKKVENWLDVRYLKERSPLILDSLEAHRAGKWTLSIPALLPLVDGITRKFCKDHLRRRKGPTRVMHVAKFADHYRRKQPRLFGDSFSSFVHENMYATVDLSKAILPPSSINRHGILHGEISDYATEANSLRVFLLLDTIAQFVRAFEKKRDITSQAVKLRTKDREQLR